MVSTSYVVPLSGDTTLFIPNGGKSLKIARYLPSGVTEFIGRMSIGDPYLAVVVSSQFPFYTAGTLEQLQSMLL